MTTPTDVLRAEHVLILRVLDALEVAAARLEDGAGPGDRWWTAAIAWLREFADRTHHAREERGLFPALVAAGLHAGGPVEVMLAEHAEGRSLVEAMARRSAAARAAAARDYVSLLRAHIEKENEILFPLAETILGGAALAWLRRELEVIDRELGPTADLAAAAARVDRLALEPVG